MKALDYTALILSIVGALNWGLIGLFRFDLVAFLFGNMSLLSRIIYVLVAVCGLYLFTFFGRIWNGCLLYTSRINFNFPCSTFLSDLAAARISSADSSPSAIETGSPNSEMLSLISDSSPSVSLSLIHILKENRIYRRG